MNSSPGFLIPPISLSHCCNRHVYYNHDNTSFIQPAETTFHQLSVRRRRKSQQTIRKTTETIYHDVSMTATGPKQYEKLKSTAATVTTTNTESNQSEQQQRSSSWIVHKFGGTSLGTADAFKTVGKLVSQNSTCTLVVVSAVGGVTDLLEGLVSSALIGGSSHIQQRNKTKKNDHPKETDSINDSQKEYHYKDGLNRIYSIHEKLATQLLEENERNIFMASFKSDLKDIDDLLRAIWIARSVSYRMKELVMGYGELWSAQILWGVLREHFQKSCSWLDTREVIVVRESGIGSSRKVVELDVTTNLMNSWVKGNPTDCIIATGFICRDIEGVPTTLGRNGSDYSAAILANVMEASELNIWTDVDGVYSADPTVVADAVVIPDMTYTEAAELAYFGAKILHPDAMAPAMRKSIPVRIRNTFNVESKGTLVQSSEVLSKRAVRVRTTNRPSSIAAISRDAKGVKGFSTVSDISMVNLEGTGMIGVPGIASRTFQSLYEQGVSVILIAQASSEYSICMAVPSSQGGIALEAVKKTFRGELQDGLISCVNIVPRCTILAVVGDKMKQVPGVSSRLFTSMTKAGVNIRAIAQGSSEHNISVVVDASDEARALQAVHAGFYLSDQTLSIGIIGPGVVGGALLEQIKDQAASLKEEFGVDMRVQGIATSKKMLLGDNLNLMQWREDLERSGENIDLNLFAQRIRNSSLPHAVICDCTSSQEVTDHYEQWIRNGIHIITPNKKANSGPLSYYTAIREAQHGLNTHFFYEANVGAGLPVISSIRDLLRTGDRFLEIQGIFSGTLSYIFNSFDGSEPFSAVVQRAKRLGYTEPDPRDDLSGMDVARKVVILAREIGLEVELSDVPVKSLVPDALKGEHVTVNEFLSRLSEYDEDLTSMAKDAAREGEMLRYVGIVNMETRTCSVELRRFKEDHPFGRLRGSDNIVTFRTKRYDEQPLVVQGPGAGAQVTAAGVFGDLLRLAAYLGAPSTANM